MAQKYSAKSSESDGKSESRILNSYNKYRTAEKYNKSDAVARIANEMGYSQRAVKEILKSSEREGKYVYSRKIDGVLANEIYEMRNAGANTGLVAETLGISERSVQRQYNRIAGENDFRTINYGNISVMHPEVYPRVAGAADPDDPAFDKPESGRERLLRKRRRLPVVVTPETPEAPAVQQVKVEVNVGDSNSEKPAYAKVPEAGNTGKPKKKKESLGVQIKAIKTEVERHGDILVGVGGKYGLVGRMEQYEGTVKSLNTSVNSAATNAKAAVDAVAILNESLEGREEGTVGRRLNDLDEAVRGDGERPGLAAQVRDLKAGQPGIVERVLPYVLFAGLGFAGVYAYNKINEKLDALGKRPAVVAPAGDVYNKAQAKNETEVMIKNAVGGVKDDITAMLSARDDAQTERDKSLEGKLGAINGGLDNLNKNYDATSKAIANEAKARKADNAKLSKDLKGYVDGINGYLTNGMKVMERNLGEVSDKLDAHLKAGEKPVVPFEIPFVVPGTLFEAPIVPIISAESAKKNYVEASVSDKVGSNANEARIKIEGVYDGLNLGVNALDSRHGTKLGRKALTAGELSVGYEGDGWSVAAGLNKGFETESRSENMSSVQIVNDGTVLSVADSYHGSENRETELDRVNVSGKHGRYNLGFTGSRWNTTTNGNVADNSVVTFDPSTGLAPLSVNTGVNSQTRVSTYDLRGEFGADVAEGVNVALIGGASSTDAKVNLNVNGASVPVESQKLDVSTIGGRARASVAQIGVEGTLLGHTGDVPSDSKFDANVNAVIDKVVADLSLGAEATFRNGGSVGGAMAGWNVERKALQNVMGTRAENDMYSLDYFNRQKQLRAYDALIDAIYEGKGNETSALLAVRAGKANSDGRKVLGAEAGIRVPGIITDGGVAAVASYTQQSGGDQSRQKTLDVGLEARLGDHVRLGVGVMFDETDGKKTVAPGIGITVRQ